MSVGKKLSKDTETTKDSDSAPKPAEKPISLRPLEFEEAIRDLLKVKPDRRSKSGLKGEL